MRLDAGALGELAGRAGEGVAVPTGIATALFLSTVARRAKPLHALILSPLLLTPGVIIGISTLIFWRELGVNGGRFLSPDPDSGHGGAGHRL